MKGGESMSKHPSLKPKRQLRAKTCLGQYLASKRKRRNKQRKEEVAHERYQSTISCVCVAIGIVILSFLPGKTFGLALVLMGAVYLGHKLTAWKWLEMIYPLVGVSTIFFGLLAFL